MVNGQQGQPVDLASRSVMLVLRLGRPGNRRKVPSGMVQADADQDAIHVGKELLESPELEAVVAADAELRQWLYRRSLPSFGTLREGVYRIPLVLVEEVDQKLDEFQEKRQGLIDTFLARYPDMVEGARARLRSLYDPGDYPPVAAIAARFTVSYRYLAFLTPETLSAQLLTRERAKAAAEVSSEVEEIKSALRAGFADLIAHAVERLGVRPDGKKVVFRDSMVAGLQEFLTYFQARNLAGDTELAPLVERARAAMQGVTAEELRSSDAVRATVKATMEQVKDEMDRNLTVRPSRRLVLPPQPLEVQA